MMEENLKALILHLYDNKGMDCWKILSTEMLNKPTA